MFDFVVVVVVVDVVVEVVADRGIFICGERVTFRTDRSH